MSLRLFAALDIPDEVTERLTALQRGVGGAKWRPRENLHLTLRFFDEVAEHVAEELDAALNDIAVATAPFEIRLRAAGAFGGAEPHTLWIGADGGEPLRKLAADCERAARRFGLAPETRKFAPHVTLAYVSRGTDLDRVQAFQSRLGLFETPTWMVGGFALYSSWLRRSQPSIYRVEADYLLRG